MPSGIPVAASIEFLVIAVVEVDVGHLLSRLYEVWLTWANIAQHGDGCLDIPTCDGQVSVGDGDAHLLSGALEVVDGVLHHFGCLVLPNKYRYNGLLIYTNLIEDDCKTHPYISAHGMLQSKIEPRTTYRDTERDDLVWQQVSQCFLFELMDIH